jgi:hypothetical protein
MILSIFITYSIYFTIFTFNHLFYYYLNFSSYFGGTDHLSHPRNMDSVFTFSYFSYCHLNFNSYIWRYGPSVLSPKYGFSIYI